MFGEKYINKKKKKNGNILVGFKKCRMEQEHKDFLHMQED